MPPHRQPIDQRIERGAARQWHHPGTVKLLDPGRHAADQPRPGAGGLPGLGVKHLLDHLDQPWIRLTGDIERPGHALIDQTPQPLRGIAGPLALDRANRYPQLGGLGPLRTANDVIAGS